MIILRLFFLLLILFPMLVMGLGILLWLKMRFYSYNPFLRQGNMRPSGEPYKPQDGNTIEGEYQVIDVPDKE